MDTLRKSNNYHSMICAQKILPPPFNGQKEHDPPHSFSQPRPYPIPVIIDQPLISSNHAIWISIYALYTSYELSLRLPVALVFVLFV